MEIDPRVRVAKRLTVTLRQHPNKAPPKVNFYPYKKLHYFFAVVFIEDDYANLDQVPARTKEASSQATCC